MKWSMYKNEMRVNERGQSPRARNKVTLALAWRKLFTLRPQNSFIYTSEFAESLCVCNTCTHIIRKSQSLEEYSRLDATTKLDVPRSLSFVEHPRTHYIFTICDAYMCK